MSNDGSTEKSEQEREEEAARLHECMGRYKHSWKWLNFEDIAQNLSRQCGTCGIIEKDIKRFRGQ